MNSIGKIGLIMPRVNPTMDNELISGVAAVIGKYGYDTVLITGVFNDKPEHFSDEYTSGMDNIYTLLQYASLDGIIFPAGRFNREDQKERIYSILRKLSVPCIVLEDPAEDFETLYPSQREYIRMITEHLIREHGCRKLFCITGKEGEYSSEVRLEGFKDAMDAAGLHYDDSSIFYGRFWYDIPQQIAYDIAVGVIDRPDGIVCTNDDMAISICNTLTGMGVRVPEDIKVTGYDGNIAAFFQNPSITTVTGHEYQLGCNAAKKILERIGHRDIAYTDKEQRLRLRTSCGCGGCIADTVDNKLLFSYMRKALNMYSDRRTMVFTGPARKICAAGELKEAIDRVAQHCYMLPNWKSIDICLCQDWNADPDYPDRYRTEGFSDNMIHALSTYWKKSTCPWNTFPTSRFLPTLSEEHKPMIFVVTSLHRSRQVFGYFCSSYDMADDFQLDEYYVNFIDTICEGLAAVQEKNCGWREVPGLTETLRNKLLELRARMYAEPHLYVPSDGAIEADIPQERFDEIYPALFGEGFAEDIRCAAIERAKWLLMSSAMTIEEIAVECGYVDADTFISDFSRKVEVSPYGYRKEKHFTENTEH